MDEEKLQESSPQEKKVPETKSFTLPPQEETAKEELFGLLPQEESPKEITPEEALAANKEMSLEQRIGTPLPFQLTVTLGKETLNTLAFDQDFVTIGRDLKCDVVIDNLGASRVHAQIERIGRFHLLRDLDSKTGTFVHTKKVEEHCLNNGDEIFLAKHTLIFQKLSSMRWHQEDAGKVAKTPKAAAGRQQLMQTLAVDFRDMAKKQGPAPASLTVLGMNRRLPLVKSVTMFGKSQRCDITVTGFLIGERHVVIAQEEKGFVLYHLGFLKPPRVNDHPVESALLTNGDLIQIGDMRFVFQLSEEAQKSS